MNLKHTKELLEPIVSSSISYAQCLQKLNLKACGGNYKHLQNNIDKYGFNTDHMLHNAANRGKEFKNFDELTKTPSIKKRLTSEIGHQCSNCKITDWLGKPITLELEHIDGNNRNHDRNNLTLLCPNCHSQTPTWRNRKR